MVAILHFRHVPHLPRTLLSDAHVSDHGSGRQEEGSGAARSDQRPDRRRSKQPRLRLDDPVAARIPRSGWPVPRGRIDESQQTGLASHVGSMEAGLRVGRRRRGELQRIVVA